MRIPRAARSRRAALLVLGALALLLASAGQAWAAGGQISGTVTDASSHAGVGSVLVDVYDSSRNFVTSATTVASGSYTVSGLATGSYEVGFVPTTGNYLAQFYSDQGSLANATVVPVPTTWQINAALMPGGQISGTVTDATSPSGLLGAEVDIYDASQNFVTSTVTAGNGTYTLSGLPSGSYEVGFVPPSGSTDAPEFYNGKASLAAANLVAVTAGAPPTSGIDALLPAGGGFSGKVTDAASPGGVGNVEVDVYDATHAFVTSTQTASDGTYTVSGLFPGNYEVGFVPTAGNDAAQFYSGQASLANATSFSVPRPMPINAVLTLGGQISGTVTDASSQAGIGRVTVNVYDSTGSTLIASTLTASDGTYTVVGLVPGSYKVEFVPRGTYLAQFYGAPVSVTAGPTSGINAALALPTLTVSLAGTGSGGVTGSGIGCPGACSLGYPTGTAVTLTASPAAGAAFVGWSGACSGIGSCVVTMNADQSVTARFVAVTADFAASPANRSAPAVAGNATTGQTLTATTGSWSGTMPLAYSYQWQRCSPGCVNITGATGSSYKLVMADTGTRVLVVVTAGNLAGRAAVRSAAVGPVGPSVAQIKASLSAGLIPSGKTARIAAIAKRGGYTLSVKSAAAGSELVSWYLVPAGAHLTKGRAPKPVLMATGKLRFTQAGTGRLKVKLSAAGKKAFKHAKRIKLSARAGFTVTGGSAVRIIKRFGLKR